MGIMKQASAASLALATVVALCATAVSGLHEDQAGLMDWQVKNVGNIIFADFDDNEATVASSRGIVGGIRMDNGEIIWRGILPEDRVSKGLSASGLHDLKMLTASQDACRLELWHAVGDGGMLWDAELCDSQDSLQGSTVSGTVAKLLGSDLSADGMIDVAAITKNALFVLDGTSGRVHHEVALDNAVEWRGIVEVSDSNSAASSGKASRRRGNNIVAYGVDQASGKLEVRKLAASGASLDTVSGIEAVSETAEAVDGGVVVEMGSTLIYRGKESGKIFAFSCVKNELRELPIPETVAKDAKISVAGESHFAVGETVFAVDEASFEVTTAFGGEPVAVFGSNGKAVAAVVQAVEGDKCGPITKVFLQEGAVPVELVDGFPEAAGRDGLRGAVVKVFPQAASNIAGARALFVFEDESVVAIEVSDDGSATTLFVREEALAGVVDVVAVDLPPLDEVGSLGDEAAHVYAHGSSASFFVFRLKDQVRTVQRFFQSLMSSVLDYAGDFLASKGQVVVHAYRGELARKESLSQSEMFAFGFRRVLVMRTESGKIFGLNSGNGAILWSVRSPGSRIFVTRAREAGVDHPAEVAIVDEETGRVTWRNALTGDVTRAEDLSTKIEQITALPGDIFAAVNAGEEDVSPAAVLVGLDAEQNVVVLPSSHADSVFAAKEYLRSLHFAVYKNETATLTGYVVDPEKRSGVELWSFVIPESQKLLTIQGNSGGLLNNPGIKRGDGSVLIKFVNSHLLLVATQSEANVQATILDGVSGRVVTRVTHKKATGPIHAVLADNMITYTFWNTVMKRQEVSAVGLFEGEIAPRDLNLWSARPSMGDGGSFSSFDTSVEPIVMQKTFYVERAIATLGVTQTRFGIADRRVLIGTHSGSVNMQLPQVLDPRRPIGKLSNEEKEEGLVLYTPELPLLPTQTITYYQSVPQLRLIKSFATRLESTALVVSAGIDVFYTRVMPSRGFDVLDEDFAFGMLIALIIALLGLTIYLSKAVTKSTVTEAWK